MDWFGAHGTPYFLIVIPSDAAGSMKRDPAYTFAFKLISRRVCRAHQPHQTVVPVAWIGLVRMAHPTFSS